jgi:FkbM family methyltransferase
MGPRTALRGVRDRVRRRRRRLEYQRIQRRLVGPKILAAFDAVYPEAAFVEIGANDGEKHDHLRPFVLRGRWRGVLVEPVPHIFERLRANYDGVAGLRFANVAVADRDGSLPFFHLAPSEGRDDDDLPEWYDTIGSFSRDNVAGHRREIPDIEERIVRVQVPTLTFASLLERHGLDHVDLLAIDTEGYDAEILKAIDFSRTPPRLVIYEHYHLDRDEQRATVERLVDAGYDTIHEGFDTFCLRPGDDELWRRWKRLSPAIPAQFADEEAR